MRYASRHRSRLGRGDHGGITGPDGLPPVDAAAQAAFTPDLVRSDDRVVMNVTMRL